MEYAGGTEIRAKSAQPTEPMPPSSIQDSGYSLADKERWLENAPPPHAAVMPSDEDLQAIGWRPIPAELNPAWFTKEYWEDLEDDGIPDAGTPHGVPAARYAAPPPPPTEPIPLSSIPATTLADKERWLENLRRQHGQAWINENWQRLEDEWAYIESL